MKGRATITIASVICLLLFPLTAKGQTDVELDPEFGGRVSLSVEKKLAKGLHLNLEEEVRFDNNLTAFNRFHTTLGIDYKVHPNVKVGVGYALINPYSTANNTFKNSRHRFMADVTGTLKFGDWRLSLKERFQATVRTGEINEYQNPRTLMALKSRLKLSYKGLRGTGIEPYASLEMRNTLNAPVIKANFDGTNYLTASGAEKGEAGWFLDGFDGVYVNRLRGSLGMDYRLDRRSTISVAVMCDYVMDKVVDANKEGTRLKSYTFEKGFVGWLTAGYRYSF